MCTLKFLEMYKKERHKKAYDKDLIFGIHPVIEALRSGQNIDTVLFQSNQRHDQIFEILTLCKERGIPTAKVPIEKLNRVTTKKHQGVVCFLSPIAFVSLGNLIPTIYEEGKVPLILILDRITDVRNFGAICRTAECAGVHAIVVPSRGKARIGSDAFKTSAGALNHISVCREMSLKNTIDYLKKSGLKIIACTEKTTHSIYDADFREPTAIIVGSEKDGISEEILDMSDTKVKIPLAGKIESLNVSVASGVILYEAVRQRH